MRAMSLTMPSNAPIWSIGGVCMKGSISLRTDRKSPYWIVNWPQDGRVYKISRYLGERELMYQTHALPHKDIGYKKAQKLLHMMQSDVERDVFRIDKYTGTITTDIIPYLQEWLAARESSLTPGGYEKYKIAVNKHLIPFFTENPVMLHEIRYDTLIKLMNWIPGGGKNKKNVVDTLRCCLKFAWKSERIPALPPFPEAKLYDINPKAPEWLPADRYRAGVEKIPPEHRPFFMFLYLHLRRPGEACALLKSDYDTSTDTFKIHRGVSANKLVEHTKDKVEHVIPCHPAFKPYLEQAMTENPFSPYMFTHKQSHSTGKRYTGKFYRSIWDKACEEAGEDIDCYRGTKTTRASQMVNEEGVSMSDLQIAGLVQHAERDGLRQGECSETKGSARRQGCPDQG